MCVDNNVIEPTKDDCPADVWLNGGRMIDNLEVEMI
jgi:hypothetical protein